LYEVAQEAHIEDKLTGEPIAKLFDAQNRPFCLHCEHTSSPACLGRPPSVRFGQASPVLAMEPKIIDFSLSWSFAIGSGTRITLRGNLEDFQKSRLSQIVLSH